MTRLRQRVNRNVSAERQAIGIVVPAIVACRSSWLKIVQIADSATKPVLGHTNASCSTGLRPPLGWFPGRPRGHDSSRLRSEMVLIMAMKRVIKSVHVIPMGMANAGRMLFAGDVCMNIMGLGDPVGFESLEEGRASQRKLAGLSFDAAGFGHGEPVAREASSCFRNKRCNKSHGTTLYAR